MTGNSGRAPEHRVHHPTDGTAVVELLGEHDLATRDTTEKVLTGLIDEHELVTVDLSETSFMDSSVVECLVRAHRHAEGKGHVMRVRLGPDAIVRTMFEVAGLTSYFELVTVDEEALHR